MMLMPDKHIAFSESLLGVGSYVLKELSLRPKSLDALWAAYRKDDTGLYSIKISFDSFLLAIGFLYSVGVVSEVQEGFIGLCD